jgi:iduronate 2-sulfatase
LYLYPTFVEACGIVGGGRRALVGRCLMRLVAEPAAAWEGAAYTQVMRGNVNARPAGRPRRGRKIGGRVAPAFMGRSVRTERWRYTEWGEGGVRGRELYDEGKDSLEMKNLAGEDDAAAVVGEMRRLLGARHGGR